MTPPASASVSRPGTVTAAAATGGGGGALTYDVDTPTVVYDDGNIAYDDVTIGGGAAAATVSSVGDVTSSAQQA